MSKTLLPVLAIALFLSFFRLGSATLFDVDEAVFSEATKEMVQSGDWITPTYNGENRYDKPIFFYWLMAASYKIFGINEFAARFPSALSAALLALSVFLFTRRFTDDKTGLYAAVPLAISPYFLIYSHAAVTDMTLTLMLALSLFSFYMHIASECGMTADGSSGKTNAHIFNFYIFSALAFLTKGLIGILFPFGIAGVFLIGTEGFQGVKRLFNLKGLVLFLIIAAPWYCSQLAINGRDFIEQFFMKHHFRRYTDVISGHRGPIYYYLLALTAGLLPWIAFLPVGIKKALKYSKKIQVASYESDERKDSASDSLIVTRHSSLNLFAFVWLAFIFVFFTLATTKLPNYILPAVPAACILISSGMIENGKWLKYENVLMSIFLASAGAALLLSAKYLTRLGLTDINWTIPAAVVLFISAAAGLYTAVSGTKSYSVLSILMLILLTILSVKATPLASEALQGTLHRYSLYAKAKLQEDEKIVTLGINNPSIVFYSDRKVARAGDKDELMPLLTQGKRALIISKAKEIGMLQELGFTLLDTDNKYAFLEKQ